MKQLRKTIWTVLLITTVAVHAQTTTVVDASNYFNNRPFGWATCRDAQGTT